MFLLLFYKVANTQNIEKLKVYNGTYHLMEAELSMQPSKQTTKNKKIEIDKLTPIFNSNKSVLLVTSECEKCTPSVFTYKINESKQLSKPVFYNSRGLYMIPYDKESFIYIVSDKKLGDDWSSLSFSNFYSKNKQKVNAMTKEKLLSIAKSISKSFK